MEPEEHEHDNDDDCLTISAQDMVKEILTGFPEDWRDRFPEKSVRLLQEAVMDAIIAVLNDTKVRNFVLELPTGVGKSAIAVCIANLVSGIGGKTYLTTATRQLQDVYERSYAEREHVAKIYSAENFTCLSGKTKKDGSEYNCKEGGLLRCSCRKQGAKVLCPYKAKKQEFIASSKGIVNLPYLLTESQHVGELTERDVIVIDECHTAFQVFQSFATVELSYRWLEGLKIQEEDLPRVPEFNGRDNAQMALGDAIVWLQEVALPKIDDQITLLATQVKVYQTAKQDELLAEAQKRLQDISIAKQGIEKMFDSVISDPTNWVAERTAKSIKVTPLVTGDFAKSYLRDFAPRRFFLSATIGDFDTFCKDMGLEPEETVSLSMPSPFPVENRIIQFMDCGKVDFRDLAGSMRPFADKVRDLLEKHKGQRGIIIVSSYKQAQELIRQVRSPRLITHEDSKGKDDALKFHARSEDSVLVSPSMHEGVDLKDDLSRFQILLKMPFASLGDASIKVRMERDEKWYANLTAQKLMQFAGRSIRSDTDYAATYILDGAFRFWYRKWGKIVLPEYFREAVRLT